MLKLRSMCIRQGPNHESYAQPSQGDFKHRINRIRVECYGERAEGLLEEIGDKNHKEAAAMVLRENNQIYPSRTRE